MTHHQLSPLQGTSAAFEQAALKRLRESLPILPVDCQLHREVWNRSTILCLDFKNCREQLQLVRSQSVMLLLAADHLGLAQSISLRVGHKVEGWKSLTTTSL
ncbi:MAG: hypothetical protein WBB82_15735 [Limnothrix sp.]